jgi:hypothetical protein
MECKQAEQILIELIEEGKLSREIELQIIQLLGGDCDLPRLGSYEESSRQEVLWHLASDSSRYATVRWTALSSLLS